MVMSLDKRLLNNHIKNGELCIIAGVKGVGKTILLLNLAEEYLNVEGRKQVLFFYSSKNGEPGGSESGGIKMIDVSELPLQIR